MTEMEIEKGIKKAVDGIQPDAHAKNLSLIHI